MSRILRVAMMVSMVCSLGGMRTSADTIWWNGATSTDLADALNWDGDAPFQGVSVHSMGFKAKPSNDKTVTLSKDLVCAGTWAFENAASAEASYRTTFDLNGHSLTFLTAYKDSNHKYVENVLLNGTIAFTNAAGTVLECNYHSSNNGYHLRLGEKANFIGSVIFQNDGTKYLTIEDGAVMTGKYNGRGNDCRLVVRGAGSTLRPIDDNTATGTFAVGGEGKRSAAYILDGALVTETDNFLLGANQNSALGNGDYAYLCVSNATLETTSPSFDGRDKCIIGGWGSVGCRMDVIGGASVTWGVVPGGNFHPTAVGYESGSSNLLYIADEGTRFVNDVANGELPLMVGMNASDNTLRVTDGATASILHIAAGGWPKRAYSELPNNVCVTSLHNRVVVNGGGKLDANGLYVSFAPPEFIAYTNYVKSVIASNVLEVAAGGSVKAGLLFCGVLYPAIGNTVLVHGEGARLEVTNRLYVGCDGSSGNRLVVTDGGQFDTVSWNIGKRRQFTEDRAAKYPSNDNLIRLDGVAHNRSEQTIEIGDLNTTNNTFWIGTGSDVRIKNVYLRGWKNALIVSNGVFHATERFYINCDANGVHTEGVGGRNRLSFYGSAARLVCEGNHLGALHDATTLDFHVPAGGYAYAAMTAVKENLTLADDLTVAFDFSELAGSETRTTCNLASATGSGKTIVASDELMAKIQAAATAEAARCGLRSATVTLSADQKTMSLRVAPYRGSMVIVR